MITRIQSILRMGLWSGRDPRKNPPFSTPEGQNITRGYEKVVQGKGKIQKKYFDKFSPAALLWRMTLFPPALLTAFNGPSRAEVRACPAVRTKGGIDPGAVLLLGDGFERTGRQAVPAIRALFGDLVGHKFECGMRSSECGIKPRCEGRSAWASFIPNSTFRIPHSEVLPHILVGVDFFLLGVHAHGVELHVPAVA
jgi:hypothetical protein